MSGNGTAGENIRRVCSSDKSSEHAVRYSGKYRLVSYSTAFCYCDAQMNDERNPGNFVYGFGG